MTEITGITPEAEEAGFYHEAGLNASWTGVRLALGALTFGFGSFAFAYFYLRSLNAHGRWYPGTLTPPHVWAGTLIMALIVASAILQTVVLQALKAGRKTTWQRGALATLGLGLAAIGLQIWVLLTLPFFPGAAGFASVYTGFYPVYLFIALLVLLWLETLLMRARQIPELSFIEQPPTFAEAFALQRFQASLSGFTVVWNYLAVVAVLGWVLFYFVH
jgi:heme/copper-type cytochrome/quinol oxidase subunit 3